MITTSVVYAEKAGREPTFRTRASRALRAAIRFISASRAADGLWHDFQTNRSGMSGSWVTAHVLWSIGELLPPEVASGAAAALARSSVGDGWGYSVTTPPDADSTIHAIGALNRFGAEYPLDRAMAYLRGHWNDETGFSTYADIDHLALYRGQDEQYSGWTQPHPCVSAIALEVATVYPFFAAVFPTERLLSAIWRCKSVDGSIGAYWWRTRLFVTARVALLSTAGASRDAAIRWVLAQQRADGWANGYDDSYCPLSTALAIRVLSALGPGEEPRLESATLALVNTQNSDGSWTGRPVLRIPPPYEADPNRLRDWRVNDRGVGSISADQNGIYTTAAVARALSDVTGGLSI